MCSCSGYPRNPTLRVTVYSFSYRDGGPPFSVTRNDGGGSVFDMRCIANPAVIRPELANRSGENETVQQFFQTESEMDKYLSHVQELVRLTIEVYRKRGCERMSIGFGCTGGKHRSVYAAIRTANFIRELDDYDADVRLDVDLIHTNEDNW